MLSCERSAGPSEEQRNGSESWTLRQNQVLEAKTVFGKDVLEIVAEVRTAEQRGQVRLKNKEAFDAWAAQNAGAVSDTAIQHLPDIEDLMEIFGETTEKSKRKITASLSQGNRWEYKAEGAILTLLTKAMIISPLNQDHRAGAIHARERSAGRSERIAVEAARTRFKRPFCDAGPTATEA